MEISKVRSDYNNGYCTERGVYYVDSLEHSPHTLDGYHFPSEYQMIRFVNSLTQLRDRLIKVLPLHETDEIAKRVVYAELKQGWK